MTLAQNCAIINADGFIRKESEMGILAALSDMAAQFQTTGDLRGLVQGAINESLASLQRDPSLVLPEFELIPTIQAAQVAEGALLEDIELLMEQLQLDGRRALPADVTADIIGAICDIKVLFFEADGFVNPIDQANIKLRANGLRGKVRQQFLMTRMARRDLPAGDQLDLVETKMIVEAYLQYGRNYAEYAREAQAAITAIAELRNQQLARP